MSESRLIEKLLMPYAFALQSLPKVAIAPLVVIWFGFGDGSKVAIAGLLAFFPVLINSFTGLRSVEPERIDLMRSLSASRFETYRIVKLPNAAPFIFAGLDMAVVYSLLGAIVAEFLGAQQGMGVVITQAQRSPMLPACSQRWCCLASWAYRFTAGYGASNAASSIGATGVSHDRLEHRVTIPRHAVVTGASSGWRVDRQPVDR